jgi:hypothetical protein
VLTYSRKAALAGRGRAIAVPVLTLFFAVSCATSQTSSGSTGSSVPLEPAPTVEQLAAKVGCTPKMQIEAADIRQGYCKTKVGQFFLTTFTTQEGKNEWMDQAPEYNPHLVGNLWTALGTRQVLDKLRDKIGGDLHLTDHRVSPSPQ